MSRPVWSDRHPDPVAVAALLDEAAQAAVAPLEFEAAPVAPGAQRKVLHQAALLRIRRQLNLSSQEEDRILAQEVRAIDDLVRSANLLVERLREWYALHSPEAGRLVPEADRLTRLVAEHGDRAAVMLALDQAKMAEQSLGSDLSPEDLAALQTFARALAGLYDAWKSLEARVIVLMGRVAPNLAAIVGPVLGARMVALAGGLQRLAVWPAGTLQLLGAETALFRHLKEGTLPPKHGLLYQHPFVHQALPHHRGAISRAIALAASTAVKADAFTKNDLRESLKARLDADLERVKSRPMRAKGPRRPMGRGPPRAGGYGRGPPRGPSASGPRYGAPGPRYGNDRRDAGPDAPGPRKWDRAPAAPARSFTPRDDAPRSFAPRDDAPRAPRDDAPRSGGWQSGGGSAPRSGGWTPRDDAPRGPPRQGWSRDDAPRGPPRTGGYGGGSGAGAGSGGGYGSGPRGDDRGPSRSPPPWKRDGPGSGGGGGYGAGAGTGWKPKRKPQGAFRSDNQPAGRPGAGSGDRKSLRRDDE